MINLLLKDGEMKQFPNSIEATRFLENRENRKNTLFVQIFDSIGYIGTVLTDVYLRVYITR